VRARAALRAAVRGVLLAGLAAGLLAAARPGPATAGPTREEALALLGDRADAEARRAGAVALGETGQMADVPALAAALRDPDALVRALAERALWEVWSRSGDREIDDLFAVGLTQMQERQGQAAVETFTRIVERRPDFAEGWNKRATVYYLLGEYQKSLADCDEVMKRNPHHFGALSGYGLIYLQLRDPARALGYFERALAVNPNLDQVRETVEALRNLLIQRRKETL
jgi:tetratricopeptide (TPR) repeat protein